MGEKNDGKSLKKKYNTYKTAIILIRSPTSLPVDSLYTISVQIHINFSNNCIVYFVHKILNFY